MKISKFNVNELSKFKKSKLMKGIAALGLTSIVATTFASCGEQEPLFRGTILENAVVAKVDDDIEILVEKYIPDNHHTAISNKIENKGHHRHYRNIVTGEWLADSDNNCYRININEEYINPRNVKISNIQSISNYLTKEEYRKVSDGTFTVSDEITVITRIKSTENAKQKIKK